MKLNLICTEIHAQHCQKPWQKRATETWASLNFICYCTNTPYISPIQEIRKCKMNPNANNLHYHKFRAVYVLYTDSRNNYISAGVQECFLTASYHHTLLVINISTDSTSAGIWIQLKLGCIYDRHQSTRFKKILKQHCVRRILEHIA